MHLFPTPHLPAALHRESEAEVQQFLRGSLAVPRQAPQRELGAAHVDRMAAAQGVPSAGSAGARISSTSPGSRSSGPGGRSHGPANQSPSRTPPAKSSPAAGGPCWVGSIDLGAILGDSRPASPARPASPGKSPLVQLAERLAGSTSSEGGGGEPWHTARSGGWHTARSGPGPEGWQTARSGGSSGAAGQTRAAAAGWTTSSDEGSEVVAEACQEPGSRQQGAGSHAAVAELQLLRISARSPSPPPAPGGSSRGRSGSASLSDVVQQTFSPEALERLDRLREQLSPGRQGQGASPQQASSRSTPSGGVPSSSAGSGGAEGGSGRREAHSRQGSPTALLPKRCGSPELPGLRISLHQARLLQV